MCLLVGAAGLLSVTPTVRAQESHPVGQATPKKSEDQFFSGNVTALKPDKVTVSRRTLTLTTITRTFLLDGGTVIEGKLQPKARVTVKLEKTDAGERAVRIIVR